MAYTQTDLSGTASGATSDVYDCLVLSLAVFVVNKNLISF